MMGGIVKRLASLLLALWIVGGTAQAAPAFTIAKRYHRCRFESLDGRAGFNSWEVRSTIACAVDHWSVPGGYGTALYIAERESGLYCHARNAYSSATGIFQVVAGTWASWYRSLVPDLNRWHWHIGYDRSQCRANIIVSVRAMHRYGLGPWR